jgi:hypothetical protein
VPFELEQHRQRVGRIGAVVYYEHAPRAAHGRHGSRADFRRLDARQANRHRRSATHTVADEADGAAVHLDQPLDDGEANAEAALRAIGRPLALHE